MMPAKSTGSAGILPARAPLVGALAGFLPHFGHPALVQMVTFRLADALPAGVAGRIAQERGAASADRWRRMGAFLDAGHGAYLLRDSVVAKITKDALLRFDGVRYHLLAWVIMPNHVHNYIHRNPCLAGHAASPEAWEFSSARGWSKGAGRMPALPKERVLPSTRR